MNVAYLVLKTAHRLYGKNPSTLERQDLRKVERMAARQFELETKVLASLEARDVVLPQVTLDTAMEEVRGRYADMEAFREDLGGNGLRLEDYEQSLARELRVEAVLDKVGSRAAQVSDIDVELYYHFHPEQFRRPELRRARHILVTVNEDMAENTASAAWERIEAIARRLLKDPARFEEQALKHSECPTALNGGLLGDVKRGQLFQELDKALFDMQAMQTSPVLASPVGLHLLRCDAVMREQLTPLSEVREKVREKLYDTRKRVCQNAWLKKSLAAP